MDELQIIQRLALIEEQLLLVSQQLGIPCPPFASTVLQDAPMTAPPSAMASPPKPAYVDEVIALARAGQTIHAIKLFRASTGASLLEAKEAIDKIV